MKKNNISILAYFVMLHGFSVLGAAFAHFNSTEKFIMRFHFASILLILAYVIYLLSKIQDPVKNCKLYKDKGCSHVDGMLCDFPHCKMNKDHVNWDGPEANYKKD